MGNATKVALVALLILMVVVVARFVREDTAAPDAEGEKVTGTKPAAATSKQAPESIARPRTSVNPGVRKVSPSVPSKTAESPVLTRSGSVTPVGTGSTPAGSLTASPASASPSSSSSISAPGSSQTPGAAAPPQSTAEPRTGASVATIVPVDRPLAVPRTSSGEPLPAHPAPASAAPVNDTQGSRSGTPGIQAGGDAKAAPPAGAALVTTQLAKKDGGGDLAPTAARSSEPGALSYGDLARAPESKSAADSSRAPAPSGRSSSSGEYPKSHEVVKGDSYWGLAQKYYGDGRLGSIIEKENPGIRMQPGKKLTIPEPPARASTPAPAPTRSEKTETPEIARAGAETAPASSSRDTYVVQRGDTLGKIARKFYGDAGKTEPIEDANPHLKYQTLQAGAKIKIPAK